MMFVRSLLHLQGKTAFIFTCKLCIVAHSCKNSLEVSLLHPCTHELTCAHSHATCCHYKPCNVAVN